MKKLAILLISLIFGCSCLLAIPMARENVNNKPITADMTSMIEGQIIYEVPLYSHVKKGQLVSEVDPKEYKANLMKDLAAIKYYKILFHSNSSLVNTGSVSLKEYYESEYNLNTAIANYHHDKAVLSHCYQYAPFNGTVTKITTYPKSGIGDGSLIMKITKDPENMVS